MYNAFSRYRKEILQNEFKVAESRQFVKRKIFTEKFCAF